MVAIVEGKDWKTLSEAIDDMCLSDTQISTLGLGIIEPHVIRDIEDQMKANIKKRIKEALGIE